MVQATPRILAGHDMSCPYKNTFVGCNIKRSSVKHMPTFSKRVSTFGTTIFSEINNLATQYGAVNLGQDVHATAQSVTTFGPT